MSIKNIEIQSYSSNGYAYVTDVNCTGGTLLVSGGIMTTLGADTSGAYIGMDNYDRALSYNINHPPYIATINGIQPAADGTFFINGSECNSIWVRGNELNMYDLCPACQTCDKLYTLIKGVEYYKTWLNTLKDVNLYTQPQVVNRRQAMVNAFVPFSGVMYSNCSTKAYVETDLSSGGVVSTPIMVADLMRQYVTTVHMWNYLVSRSGTETQITVAPEDDSGFVVQTKYALPACSPSGSHTGNPTLKCTITIMCDRYPISDNVRVVKLSTSPAANAAKTILFKRSTESGIATWCGGTVTSGGTQAALLTYYTGASEELYRPGCAIYKDSALTISEGFIYSYNPLSLYLPAGIVSYRPFAGASVDITSEVIPITTGTYPDLDKKIVIRFGSAASALEQAGTYQASIKLLPFIHTEVWTTTSNGTQKLDFDQYLNYWKQEKTSGAAAVYSGGVQVSGGTAEKYYLGAVTVADVQTTPTLQQYEGAKMYPSKSPTRSVDSGAVIRWTIDIDWETNTDLVEFPGGTAGGSASYTEHYVYETAGVREYIDGLFLDTDLDLMPVDQADT